MVNKKILIFASVFFLIFLLGNISGFVGGDGTAQNPYQISTCQELQNMKTDSQTNYPNFNANYILNNDIDCSDTGNSNGALWNNGAGFVPLSDFRGTFNGKEYSIANLYINRPSTSNIGLFKESSQSSKIYNLHLISIQISGKNNVGGIIGQNNGGKIYNSSVMGRVNGNSNVGGLIGNNLFGGIINTSYALSQTGTGFDITGNDDVGGLVGHNEGVSNSYSIISNSYSTNNVRASSANSYDAGSLAGYNRFSSITNSYSTGQAQVIVSGNTIPRELVGETKGTCSNSFWDKDTSGKVQGVGECGTAKTTAEMKQQTTFTNWDFTNIWQINQGNDYPCLRGMCLSGATTIFASWTSDNQGLQKITSQIEAPIPYQEVYLVVEMNSPQQNSYFEIWEKDSLGNEAIRTGANKLTGTISIDKIISEWTITQTDIDRDIIEDSGEIYKFYFKLYDSSNNLIITSPILDLEWQTGGQPPTCSDNSQNQDETGIDCGGSTCLACVNDDCTNDNDCQSGNCENDICVECSTDTDCQSGENCVNNICVSDGGLDCAQYHLCSDATTLEACSKADSCEVSLGGCSWSGNFCNTYEDQEDDDGNNIRCVYEENTDDDCKDGILTYSLITLTAGCKDKEDISIFCSAQTSLPLENKFGILLTIISIIGIYFVFFRKKNE